MKKTMIAANVAALLALGATATQVQAVEFMDGKLNIGGAAMQSWQTAIEVDGAAKAPEDQDSGFHRLRYALTFSAQLTDTISVFAELAEEPNDNPQFTQDLAWIQFQKDGLGLRVGNVVSTTQNFIEYSDGAAVQSNPLIGNSPVDMITAEEGLWLYGSSDNYTWDAVLSKPSFGTDFSKDSGYNFGLRGTFGFDHGFSLGAGLFITNADLECDANNACSNNGAHGIIGSLIGIGDGDNYEYGTDTGGLTGTPGRGSHFAIVPGISATIWQIDAQYKTDNLKLNAYFGIAQDDYSWADSGIAGYRPMSANFTNKESEVSFMSVKAKYDINKELYVAARYSQSTNDSEGISGNDSLDRIQLGLGYWIEDKVLLKVEYVKQTEEAFSGGQSTDGTGEAEWDGILAELSVSF
jgi:hypothetical protein